MYVGQTAVDIAKDKIKIAILVGLAKSGREKTFSQILQENKISVDDQQLLRAANVLEDSGLIHNISYQLPITIRAELTSKGMDFVRSLQASSDAERSSSKNFVRRWWGG